MDHWGSCSIYRLENVVFKLQLGGCISTLGQLWLLKVTISPSCRKSDGSSDKSRLFLLSLSSLSLTKVSSRMLLLHKLSGAYRPGIVSHLALPPEVLHSTCIPPKPTNLDERALLENFSSHQWKKLWGKKSPQTQGLKFSCHLKCELEEGFILLPQPSTRGDQHMHTPALWQAPLVIFSTLSQERATALVLVQLKFIQNIERQQQTSSSTLIINSSCLYCPVMLIY